MTPETFVRAFFDERKAIIESYFQKDNGADVALQMKSLNLDSEQETVLKNILYAAFRDVMYTILLGLEGEASIGGKQELYSLCDEQGNELTGGEIEGWAWEYFQNNKGE